MKGKQRGREKEENIENKDVRQREGQREKMKKNA